MCLCKHGCFCSAFNGWFFRKAKVRHDCSQIGILKSVITCRWTSIYSISMPLKHNTKGYPWPGWYIHCCHLDPRLASPSAPPPPPRPLRPSFTALHLAGRDRFFDPPEEILAWTLLARSSQFPIPEFLFFHLHFHPCYWRLAGEILEHSGRHSTDHPKFQSNVVPARRRYLLWPHVTPIGRTCWWICSTVHIMYARRR